MRYPRHRRGAVREAGIAVTPVNKVMEGRPHIVDMIKNGEIALIINTVDERRCSDPGLLFDPPLGPAGRA